MKKTSFVILAAAFSVATMSFKPEPRNINSNLVTKLEKSNLENENKAKVGNVSYSCTPLLVYAAVSLAETSYAATMVATAAAVNYVVGTNEVLASSIDLEESINDSNLHSLDKN